MHEQTLLELLKDAITLSQAAKVLSMRPSVATLHRWHAVGVKGIKLAAWRLGGKLVTTPSALEAFLRELNAEPLETSSNRDESGRRAKQVGTALDALLAGTTKTNRPPK